VNTLTNNVAAAQQMARQTIDERVRQAADRAQVRAIRAERRAVRRSARSSVEPQAPDLPWWVVRLLRPVP
jgi:hypothetical protein